MICKLCGKEITGRIDGSKMRCSNCGLNVFFDENGDVLGYSVTDTLYTEPQKATEITSEDVTEAESAVSPESSETLPKRSRKPYGLVRATVTVCLLTALVLTSVYAYRYISKEYIVPLNNIKTAESLLREKDYLASYNLFELHKDVRGVREILSHFVFKPQNKKTLSDDLLIEYYPNGLIKSEINRYTNTNYASIKLYYYDEQSRLLRTELYDYYPPSDEIKDIQRYVFYSYNYKGLLEKETTVLPDGEIEYTVEYEYNDRGNLSAKHRGSVSETYEYDSYGRQTKKTTSSFVYQYEYNNSGQCIKETATLLADPSLKVVTEMTYDEHGNVLSEAEYNLYNGKKGEGTIYNNYKYKYDSYGNLLTRYHIDKNGQEQAIERYDNYICYYVE